MTCRACQQPLCACPDLIAAGIVPNPAPPASRRTLSFGAATSPGEHEPFGTQCCARPVICSHPQHDGTGAYAATRTASPGNSDALSHGEAE